jgi:branched-chain amino acid transport system permease protein
MQSIINHQSDKLVGYNMLIPAIWMAALVYASELTLLSIGFTLTYLTAKVPNFAHGTYAGVGIYVSFTFAKIMNLSPYYGFPLSFILGGVLSVIIYILVIGVLTRMGGGAIVLTISTLAIQIFLTALIQIYAYYWVKARGLYASMFLLKDTDFTFGGFPGIFTVSISITILSVLALHYMLTRTKMGIAMRATAEDPELSSVLGININQIQIFSWFLTGGLACLAGAMIPMWFMSTPVTGAAIITSIMAGSLLGGFESIYGAVIGGMLVGMSEIMLTLWGQETLGVWVGEWRPVIPMAFLVAVLLIEPEGLQGVWDKFAASERGDKILKSIGLRKEVT